MIETQPELKRDLGIWSAASIVVGTMIGSAIFLVPGGMVKNVGSPLMVLAVFAFGGVLSLCGALSYAELAAALPEAGGEYVYLREAYGPLWGFIYGWTQMWVAKSGSIATLATGFFHLSRQFSAGTERDLGGCALAAGRIRPSSGDSLRPVARHGSDCGAGIDQLFWGQSGRRRASGCHPPESGAYRRHYCDRSRNRARFGGELSDFAARGGRILGFFAALVAALWAYDGWNNVVMVASEVRKPQRNLPLGLILGHADRGRNLSVDQCRLFPCFAGRRSGRPSDRVAGEMMRRVLGSPARQP